MRHDRRHLADPGERRLLCEPLFGGLAGGDVGADSNVLIRLSTVIEKRDDCGVDPVVASVLGAVAYFAARYLGGVPDQRNSFLYATIGKHTIPVLEGLGIEYMLLNDGDGLEVKIGDAVRAANAQRAPFALLFAGEFSV